MSAILALRAAEVAGVVLAPDVQALFLEAPSAPSPLILRAVFQHRSEIADLLRHRDADGGDQRPHHRNSGAQDQRHHHYVDAREIPRPRRPSCDWAEALAALSLSPRLEGFSPNRWECMLSDAERFVEVWAERASALRLEPSGCLWTAHPSTGSTLRCNGTDPSSRRRRSRCPPARPSHSQNADRLTAHLRQATHS